jgi:hypothetical protein
MQATIMEASNKLIPAKRGKFSVALFSLVIGLATLIAGPDRAAAKMMFGQQDSLTKLADTQLLDQNGSKLSLCTKSTSYFFILGVYASGDVVLCDETLKGYYPLPEGSELSAYQKAGKLPDPLPAADMSAFDYVLGYSLWIGLACWGVWHLFSSRRAKTQMAESTSLTSTAVLRAMATSLVAGQGDVAAGTKAAQAVYEQIAETPLQDAALQKELTWAAGDPVGCTKYFETMARTLGDKAGALLFCTAADVAHAMGPLARDRRSALLALAATVKLEVSEASAYLDKLTAPAPILVPTIPDRGNPEAATPETPGRASPADPFSMVPKR